MGKEKTVWRGLPDRLRDMGSGSGPQRGSQGLK